MRTFDNEVEHEFVITDLPFKVRNIKIKYNPKRGSIKIFKSLFGYYPLDQNITLSDDEIETIYNMVKMAKEMQKQHNKTINNK